LNRCVSCPLDVFLPPLFKNSERCSAKKIEISLGLAHFYQNSLLQPPFLGEDDATVGLDGSPFPMQGTGASSLGGTSATASATVKRSATGTSSLGGTSSTASVTVKHSATGASSLNGTSALASATVVVLAVASADLGGLDASAQAKAKKGVSANADLGGLDASATTKVSKDVVASASLGGLDASATTKVDKSAIASADLGSLVASATATINPPEPPPVDDGVGYQQPYRQRPLRKQVKPVEIPIQIELIPESTIIVAQGMSRLGGIDCLALGSITFSTLADDAEVLLLI
jgi:hypothetical protein